MRAAWRSWPLLLLPFCAVPAASAAPYRARGEAKASGKETSPEQLRRRATQRAQEAALTQAIETVSGPVDPKARKAVLDSVRAWTGAYRIVDERTDGDTVVVELEVEIDEARLAKRLLPPASGEARPLFRFGRVTQAPGCADASERVRTLLELGGALSTDGGATPVQFELSCNALGPVRHTFLHAARVSVRASADGRVIATATAPGSANDPDVAVSTALERAVGEIGAELSLHRRGEVAVSVLSPLPAARVRRLERAITEAVVGVSGVELGGISTQGAVTLRVLGELDAATLARRLEALSLPGFSVTIEAVEAPDALTIRLR